MSDLVDFRTGESISKQQRRLVESNRDEIRRTVRMRVSDEGAAFGDLVVIVADVRSPLFWQFLNSARQAEIRELVARHDPNANIHIVNVVEETGISASLGPAPRGCIYCRVFARDGEAYVFFECFPPMKPVT